MAIYCKLLFALSNYKETPLTGQELIKILGGWEGYRVSTAGPGAGGKADDEVWIELIPESRPGVCDGCGRTCRQIHDTAERWIRDLPVFGKITRLLVHRRRVLCPVCGPKIERLMWLDRHARHTTRFAESVARLCKVAANKHVAQEYKIHRGTVKEIDKRYLNRTLGPVDLSGVTLLAMDEFAIQKGHRYATVIVEPIRKQVLWIGRGRGRADVRPFFELLGEEGCKRIQAVAMDMNAGYELEVQAQCPQAKIVFDLYHVVAKFNREVTDRVRVDEANRLRDDKPARKIVKSARWLLLRNRKNLKTEQRISLSELLAANRRLMTIYVLKDDLKHLWDYRYEGAARRFWKRWYSRAIRSRIDPLKKFAQKLKGYVEGIFSHCRYRLHTGLLEGMNNKIKVIKRMAYGYRDDEYFFLKIRQAFPGNPS
jgi:transposase